MAPPGEPAGKGTYLRRFKGGLRRSKGRGDATEPARGAEKRGRPRSGRRASNRRPSAWEADALASFSPLQRQTEPPRGRARKEPPSRSRKLRSRRERLAPTAPRLRGPPRDL